MTWTHRTTLVIVLYLLWKFVFFFSFFFLLFCFHISRFSQMTTSDFLLLQLTLQIVVRKKKIRWNENRNRLQIEDRDQICCSWISRNYIISINSSDQNRLNADSELWMNLEKPFAAQTSLNWNNSNPIHKIKNEKTNFSANTFWIWLFTLISNSGTVDTIFVRILS